MWAAIRWLVLRLAAVRWLFKLSGLALLLPIALLLKTIGLPLLAVLSIVGLPILFLLLIFGLPIILVLILGGLLMGVLGVVLTIGIAAVKIGIFVVLPLWLVWAVGSRLYHWISSGRNGGQHKGGEPTPPPSTPEPDDGFDAA